MAHTNFEIRKLTANFESKTEYKSTATESVAVLLLRSRMLMVCDGFAHMLVYCCY